MAVFIIVIHTACSILLQNTSAAAVTVWHSQQAWPMSLPLGEPARARSPCQQGNVYKRRRENDTGCSRIPFFFSEIKWCNFQGGLLGIYAQASAPSSLKARQHLLGRNNTCRHSPLGGKYSRACFFPHPTGGVYLFQAKRRREFVLYESCSFSYHRKIYYMQVSFINAF